MRPTVAMPYSGFAQTTPRERQPDPEMEPTGRLSLADTPTFLFRLAPVGSMLRVFAGVVAYVTLFAMLLFFPAGTLAWGRAWVLLAVLLVVRTAGAIAVFRVNPALLRERARLPVHRDQPRADKLLLWAVMAAFAGLPVAAGLDVFRWRMLPKPAPLVAAFGLVLFAVGWAITALALRANAFAITVVRLQADRKHTVVDTGVYGVVRHPMYAGVLLVLVGLGLWLESYAAALLAVVPIGLLAVRIGVEERFLRRTLAGYGEYAERVPHRLLPGIW